MKRLVRIAIIAAIYIVLTILLEPISFGVVQFRLSEILMVLCIYKFDYVISLGVGCLISNIFSAYGIVDVLFGTFATLISGVLMYFVKKKFIVWIFPVLLNGIIISLEITLISDLKPFLNCFLINSLTIMAGEALVIIIGIILFYKVEKNEAFMEIIRGNDYEKDNWFTSKTW